MKTYIMRQLQKKKKQKKKNKQTNKQTPRQKTLRTITEASPWNDQ